MANYECVVKETQRVNSSRSEANLARRIIKRGEESGETCEAYLSVTSMSNAKEKTWEDVVEEAVDTAIMGMDIALTPTEGRSEEEQYELVMSMFEKKLNKWVKSIADGKDITMEKINGSK